MRNGAQKAHQQAGKTWLTMWSKENYENIETEPHPAWAYIEVPLLTLRPRLLFARKGSMTLKCLDMKGNSWFSWPIGKAEYTELQALRKTLLSNSSPPSFRGGSAARYLNRKKKSEPITARKLQVYHPIRKYNGYDIGNPIVPVISGSERMGTGPQRPTQKLSQSNLLKNSRKR